MAQVSRRIFLYLIPSFISGLIIETAEAAKGEKINKKKATPKPSPKKATPKPSPKKSTPSPSLTKSATSSPSPSPSPSKTAEGVFIAKSADLEFRQTKVFSIKDSFGISSNYSLTRTTKGVVAFDMTCTHAGAPTFLKGPELHCPAHGSIFNPEFGSVIRGPATEPLKSYPTIESAGEIRIIIP